VKLTQSTALSCAACVGRKLPLGKKTGKTGVARDERIGGYQKRHQKVGEHNTSQERASEKTETLNRFKVVDRRPCNDPLETTKGIVGGGRKRSEGGEYRPPMNGKKNCFQNSMLDCKKTNERIRDGSTCEPKGASPRETTNRLLNPLQIKALIGPGGNSSYEW